MTDNLVGQIDNLNDFEMAFILRRLNAMEVDMNVHLGTLPFVNLELVKKALNFLPATSPNPEADVRKAKAILKKLTVVKNTIKFQIQLNDQMVLKWSSGLLGERRLIRLPFKKLVEAGIRWQEFGKKWVKPEQQSSEMAILTRLWPGMWEVECSAKIAEGTKNYLFAQHGAGYIKVRLKAKKGKRRRA